MLAGIVAGRTKKFYEAHAFLNQLYIFEEEGQKPQAVASVLKAKVHSTSAW